MPPEQNQNFNNPPSQNISPQGLAQTPPPSNGKGLIWALSIVIVFLLSTLSYIFLAGNGKTENEVQAEKFYDGQNLVYLPQNFEFTPASGWQELDGENLELPKDMEQALFAFENSANSCVMAYVRSSQSLFGGSTYRQTSFADRVMTTEGRQFDSSWYLHTGSLPDNFEFQWEGKQTFPGEVRIVHHGGSFSSGEENSVTAFILYDKNGNPVPDTCSDDFSQMISTIRERYETKKITDKSSGVVYFDTREKDRLFSGTYITSVIFRPDGSNIDYLAAELPKMSYGPAPIVYDGIIYHAENGRLKTLNIITQETADLDNLGLSGNAVVVEFFFTENYMLYLAGPDCNEYLAKCHLDLYAYDMRSGDRKLLASGVSSRQIIGYSEEDNLLLMEWGEGDGGCFWGTTEMYDFSKQELLRGEDYGSCGDEADYETEAQKANDFRSRFSDKIFVNDYILLKDGEIIPTKEDGHNSRGLNMRFISDSFSDPIFENSKDGKVGSDRETYRSAEDPYTFKEIKDNSNVGTQKFGDTYVDIYKDGDFIKRVLAVKDASGGAKSFKISPDGRHVAFVTSVAGGTCVYVEYPLAIDLKNFAVREFNKILDSRANTLESIRWISNSEVEVVRQYGMKFRDGWDCGGEGEQEKVLHSIL
ncbi:MAG: hypothetical protein Q8P86_02225 [bacterium]|nr:hypothetical protein [bacterium]